MFTGIIQNLATVHEKTDKGGCFRFTFELDQTEKKLTAGESIAVNGTCLTLVKASGRKIQMDIIPATLKVTSLGDLKKGSRVNIERSLKWGDAIGGHFLSGHVDARVRIRKILKRQDSREWVVELPASLRKFIVLKGSVALEGISLTVQEVSKNTFTLSLIPHTLKVTTLGQKKTGDYLNLEVDMIARYGYLPISEQESSQGLKKKIKAFRLKGF